MRSIWKGAVSFGLVNVPVKLYAATESHDIRFHQVHRDDGGRIHYKRTCGECGKEIAYEDIVKGYETSDGHLVTVSEEELAELPVPTGHEIDVVEFVERAQVDPMLLDRSYYLEPDGRSAKAYALLRETLAGTDRMAVVKVSLRNRESLAALHVRGKVIVLQTMRWPDEIREPDFDVLDEDVDLRKQELSMAGSLVDSMTTDFDPSRFEDEYAAAVKQLVEAKVEGGDAGDVPQEKADEQDRVVDLMSALERSVQNAKSSKKKSAKGGSTGGTEKGASKAAGSRGASKSGSKSGSEGKAEQRRGKRSA